MEITALKLVKGFHQSVSEFHGKGTINIPTQARRTRCRTVGSIIDISLHNIRNRETPLAEIGNFAESNGAIRMIEVRKHELLKRRLFP